MKLFFGTLVATLLAWRFWSDSLNAIWMGRWAVLMMLLLIPLAIQVGKKVSWYVAPLVFMVLFSSVHTVFWFTKYNSEPFEVQSAIRQSSAMAGFSFLMLGVFFYHLNLKSTKTLSRFLAGSSTILALVIYIQKILFLWPVKHIEDVSNQVWLLDNPSMAGCFIASALFLTREFFDDRLRISRIQKPIYTAFVIGALLLLKTTLPLLALGVPLVIQWGSKLEWKKLTALLIFSPLLLIYQPLSVWFQDNARFLHWHWALEWYRWLESPVIKLFGAGPGTTRVIFPLIQAQRGVDVEKGPWIFWLHNDWLQGWIELGLFGLLAMLWCAYGTWKMTERRPWLRLACLSYAFTMYYNFPVHWPIHAVLGWTLLALVFKEKHENHYSGG